MVRKVVQSQTPEEMSEEYSEYMRNRLGEEASSSGLIKEKSEIMLRKNSVKDIIISHIDEDYHKKILDHKGDDCNANTYSTQRYKRPFNSTDEYGTPVKRNKLPQTQRARGRGSGNPRGRYTNFRGNSRANFRARGTNRGSKNNPTARRADLDDGLTDQENFEEGDGQYDGYNESGGGDKKGVYFEQTAVEIRTVVSHSEIR
ncbi:unnamed protein product, partial [Iphiclides podalirius]